MDFIYILELAGTAFFAISGALSANEKSKPDWLGVSFIGFVTSIGGGSLRDMMLGSFPLSWIRDVNYIYAIILGVVFTSLAYPVLIKLRRTFFLFDTLGIAMFTILGVEKALQFNVNPVIAAIMGMFSAVMGGVIRDVLTNEIPVLFQKTIYASACLAGATCYLSMASLHINSNINTSISIALIFTIRFLAVKYNLYLPQFKRDTT